MKRMVIILLIIFIILMMDSNVYADGMCTRVYINGLKEIAKNIEVNYEHNIYNNSVDDLVSIYDVMLSGLTNEMYVTDDSGNNYYYEMMEDNLLNIKLSSGQRKIYIYSKNCVGAVLNVINLDLPKFNFNSLSEECKKEDFMDLDICSKFLSDNENIINEEDFKEQIEMEKRKNENFVSKIKRYILENSYLVIIGGLVLLFIIILLVVRKKRKERLE